MSELSADRNNIVNCVSKIGTHDGCFHCDEVLGCFMLKLLHPNAVIVRSRDENVLKPCDIVIDVGSLYDHKLRRYDHHQRGFVETGKSILKDKNWCTKLSSAGLVYCHYGKEVISAILGIKPEDEVTEMIFDKVYEGFVQEIDAIDNGIPISEGEQKYHISTDLSSRVKRLNKSWNDVDYNEEESFNKALKLVGDEFIERIRYFHQVWWPGRKMLKESIKGRYNVHPSGEIIELKMFFPWNEHYFDVEAELKLQPTVKYVLFPGTEGNEWRVRAVPLNAESFVLRIPLAEEWRGLRDSKLSEISGINGCLFVHSTGFIGGNKTNEGAREMAIKTLELSRKN